MICSRCARSIRGSSGRCAPCDALASATALGAVTDDTAGTPCYAGVATDGTVAVPMPAFRAARGRSDLLTGPGDPFRALDAEGPRPGDAARLHADDATGPGIEPPAPDATRLGPAPAAYDPDETRPGGPSAADRLVAEDRGHPPAPGSRTRTVNRTARPGSSDAATDLVGQPLGTRYRILRLLGAGGMGAVYEAWDQELAVVVALKTVRPEIAADSETAEMLDRRFKQELLLARQITHKNIVRVHDMGEVDGLKYITMPYLEGEDLATILKREGKLPVERVLPIARQVAAGLAAAHEAGVVHRDLKPANVMIEATGDALIMDFGVATPAAKSLTRAVSADHSAVVMKAAGHTTVGSVVGTIEYMAPEQARAQPVDQRSDIYAFGLILYDLLLGRMRASRTDSVMAELNLRLKAPPPPPRAIDPGIPEPLDRIITKCIETDADARYARTADLIADLARLDDDGRPLPIMRRLTWRMSTAVAVLVSVLVATTWWLSRGPEAPVTHEPVSVLIADFENGTGDAAFDRTLEPMVKLALEGAGFISAYDRGAIRHLGVRPPQTLDENAAMALAVKQGLNVVLSGRVDRQGNRYGITLKATQAVTGTVLTNASDRTSQKEDVIGMAARLATPVRKALGDTTSDSAQRFAAETLSAASLDAIREYARGMDAMSGSRFEEALRHFSRAVVLDPEFGTAYGALAATSRNLDRQQDAVKYATEALKHLDRMTERERYRARGYYYFLTNDYQACVKEYGDLTARYSADAAARNNRALCLTSLRDLTGAVDEMRQAVKILPQRALYRQNLATYAAYSGDFGTAEQELQILQEPGLFGLLPRAFAQLLQGRTSAAALTYESLGRVDDQGASYTASGLGDLAVHEGRFSDATRILAAGAAADLQSGDPDRAANKFIALAHAELLRDRRPAAIAAAENAIGHSREVKIRFMAGRTLAEAGAPGRARAIAAGLTSELQAEPQAYGKIIEGLIALGGQSPRDAIQPLTEANRLLDTWIGHFDLGRAYLKAGVFLQADSEFDRCVARRGEALSLFMDEEPTYGHFPPVYYYQGRVREGLKSARAVESYRAYLDIRGKSTEDPLMRDARTRAAGRE